MKRGGARITTVPVKTLSLAQEHELMRRQLWCDTVSRTASAGNCSEVQFAISWADAALKAFDLKFDALREPV